MLVYENRVKPVKCAVQSIRKLDSAAIKSRTAPVVDELEVKSETMILSEINIFPVKSLRGHSPQSARVEPRGFEHDRRWLLVDRVGRFMTQREFPKMAVIEAEIRGGEIFFRFDGRSCAAEFEPAGDESTVQIWNDKCGAIAYDVPVNAWFSDVLGTECRLVKMTDTTVPRPVDRQYARNENDHVSFADGFPYLLLGEASVGELNRRLDQPVPINRFRPNLVVRGSGAFDEDGWSAIRIGEVEFDVVKPCARCVVTTVDQENGIMNGVEPLRSLAQFRTFERGGSKKVLFGQNLLARNLGTVRVGDPIAVLERRA